MENKLKERNNTYCFRKIFLVMRITLLLFILSTSLSYSANSYAQSAKLSLHMNNAMVKDVLKAIEGQSEFIFFYQDQQVDLTRKVTINAENKSADEILEQLFAGTKNVFSINDRQVIIAKSQNTKTGNGAETAPAPAKKHIKGKILDSKGVPVPGATVAIIGTTVGTISDADGYYSIDAAEGDILRFTFVGYKEQQIKIGNQTSLDAVLKEDVATLDEAVVVGMGTQRKASVIGSISTIAVNELRVPQRSLVNALSGRMAGAITVQRSGEPGADDASFWIRGISTFGANRSPLILVDGVERSMSDLSTEEVASISILKDASATAVYGVRAANGVVLVTTRKGVAQKKPTVELKMEYGVSDLPRMPKFIDGVQYAQLYNEALGRDNYSPSYIENLRTGVDPYLYPNVNWFKETYNKYANNKQTSININGGGEVARYFVSFGYLDETGNLKNSAQNSYNSNIDLKRYNFRSNVDITLNKTLVMDLEVAGYLTDLHTPGIGGTLYSNFYTPAEELFYWSYLATPISNPVRIPIRKDGAGNDIWGWGAPTQVGEKNPAERLFGTGYNSSYRSQIYSQLSISQDLKKITEGLKFTASFSFDAYNNTEIQRRKNSSTYGVQGRDATTGDLIFKQIDVGQDFLGYSSALGSNRSKELKAQLIYDRLFKNHRVGSMFMYYQRDYINGAASTSILSLPYRKQGMAYRASYSYKDRYFTEFNIGYNGSENFPKGSRFGFFPAIAGGWLVSNEPIWAGLKETIGLLKIKGSAGLVGAEALPNGERYAYLSVYGNGLGGYQFGEAGTAVSGTGENRIGITALTWEKGLKKNVGFEMRMFDDALSIEADYFHEKRSDILVQRQTVPAFAGMISTPFANMGEMVNHGFDGTVQFSKNYQDWGFKAYGNFTYTRDKITKMDEPQKLYPYRMLTGQKYNQNFGLISLGYFESDDDIKNSPTQTFGTVRPGDIKYKDVNGDGKITIDDQVPIGYSNIPEIVYGFGLQVDYKGFDLGIFMRGQDHVTYQLGGSYIPFAQGVGKGNLFAEALDRWTVDNPRQDAQYPRLYNGTSSNNWQASTKTTYNGSFLRLADIELGKSLSKDLLQMIHMKYLRFYVHVNNAAVFSKWKMWDPETGDNDGGKYPLQRKINFGIMAKF